MRRLFSTTLDSPAIQLHFSLFQVKWRPLPVLYKKNEKRTLAKAARDNAATCVMRLSPGCAYATPAICVADVVKSRIRVCRTKRLLERQE